MNLETTLPFTLRECMHLHYCRNRGTFRAIDTSRVTLTPANGQQQQSPIAADRLLKLNCI